MKQDKESRYGTVADILIFLFAVVMIAGIINAVIFFGGKVIEWLGR